jgi:hypothetical protein
LKIISNTEDNLEKSNNSRIWFNYICTETKSMAFKGQDPNRSKIVIDNKIIEQVNSFNYLENMISYENEMDVDNKLNNYLKITGIINNMFRPKNTLKKARIKLYNTPALPTLLFGRENWTIKARDATRITAAEMKYEKNSWIHLYRS